MAGTITHRWDGTVLTITSDSGTSSADLQGAKGKAGIRGPQGRAGVILKEDGTVDMNGYATEAYVIDAIEVALEDYTPSGGGGGGGGGGSSNNAEMSLKSTTGWTYKAISDGSSCMVSGTWSSIENEMPTGSGTLTLYNGSSIKMSRSVPQGDFSLDVAPYLNAGSNTIKIKITDVYGNNRTIAVTVNKLSLTITSTFDDTVAYSSEVNFTYIPTGNATKTVYFILDGKEIGAIEVTSSGRQQSFTIPKQSHGSHKFEVYFTVDLDGEPVPSNRLCYDIMFTTSGITTPIISCAYNTIDVVQFETVNIRYTVYNPISLTSAVVLKEGTKVVSDITVDRTQQTWSYRADIAGEVTLTINCGNTVKTITLNVTESPIDVNPTTDSLELLLSSYGRSNNEANPASWEYKDIKCRFSGYNWVSDGWQLDDDGITVHRVSGDARLTIPLKMFASDFRTTGKTIEFEFATRDVRNYDATIVSCYSGDVGFKMTAQKALLKSEQSEIFTQYKDDEHIRVSFVVEKKAENRLILIYLNGIMCGAVQYPTEDDFSQGSPVNISIGSSECTIDLYNIRVYNNDLTRHQIVDNWIADTQDIKLKAERYARNDVYDAYGNIVIENLPSNLPYVILTGPMLPQYKGNQLTIDGEFVDPTRPNKSFKFVNGDIDVQGTSSAGYARKNFLLTLTNGLSQNGVMQENYQMRNNSVPTDCFCFKADVASSEGCNNVELVRLYNTASPFKTEHQKVNSFVRQGIDGFPMVIFHNNGDTTEFIGKYNFNNDKSTPEVFGFDTGDESWEIRNNTSNRVLWKSADFSGTDWKNDFEARYPKDNTNVTNLKRFAEWVVSTDTTQATNANLGRTVTYGNNVYSQDTVQYRLDKFKYELKDYAEVDSALFYYLFTELFLMVDSRAKNAFPSLVGSDKICWLPYDMDTAIGINNEGALVYGYSLEDTDITESGADVYNGQDSVFWCNIRDCFGDELKEMYQELRSKDKISYDIVEGEFEAHQAVWPEAIWNEDAYYKYIEPLIEDGAGIYLPMLQGSKSEQRKWWLYNRFRYIDSKYNAGDSLKDFITLRGYAKQDITVEPYADIYATIKYGSYLEQIRALRGGKYTLACPLDNVNDTEIYIYSASQLKDIGDVSGLKVGLADFSKATKIQSIKVGDGASTYSNGNLNSLTLGNNVLLKTLDARNCPALGTDEQKTLDLSGCSNIEEIYLTGTSLKGVSIPDGGVLKKLHLPDTLTSLSICNQPELREVVLNNPANITTLRLENVDEIFPAQRVFDSMAAGGRVRIIGTTMTLVGVNAANAFFNKLDTMRGLDEKGNNVDDAQISGYIQVTSDCEPYIAGWKAKYPSITFDIMTFDFATASWAQINKVCESGMANTFFSVGDERNITLSTGEVITVVILGFSHDTLSDDSGKANISIGLKNCVENSFNGTVTRDGYDDGTLRTKILSYFDLFPADLQSIIKTVKKDYAYGGSNSLTPSTSVWSYKSGTVNDKLWAFSHYEIMGVRVAASSGSGDSDACGTQYEYFKMAPIPEGGTPAITGTTTGTYTLDGVAYNANAIKGLGNDAEPLINYKTRSINVRSGTFSSAQTTYCFCIKTDGSSTNYSNTAALGVIFGFCI